MVVLHPVSTSHETVTPYRLPSIYNPSPPTADAAGLPLAVFTGPVSADLLPSAFWAGPVLTGLGVGGLDFLPPITVSVLPVFTGRLAWYGPTPFLTEEWAGLPRFPVS
jgi:hypothetical protein